MRQAGNEQLSRVDLIATKEPAVVNKEVDFVLQDLNGVLFVERRSTRAAGPGRYRGGKKGKKERVEGGGL